MVFHSSKEKFMGYNSLPLHEGSDWEIHTDKKIVFYFYFKNQLNDLSALLISRKNRSFRSFLLFRVINLIRGINMIIYENHMDNNCFIFEIKKIFKFKNLNIFILKLFRKSQIHQIQEEQIVLRKKNDHFSLKVTKNSKEILINLFSAFKILRKIIIPCYFCGSKNYLFCHDSQCDCAVYSV